MNVAVFASAFHPSLGGVEELVRQLAHALTAHGHSVIVVTERWPRSLPAFEVYEGIPIYRLTLRVPDGAAKAHLNYHLTHRQIERQLLNVLRQHKIELAHVQCVSSNAYYALQAKARLQLPLVVTLQGELSMDANRLFERSRFARSLMHRALEKADAVTACSAQTLSEAERFCGKPFEGRGRVIYNGIRLADFVNVLPYQHSRPYVFAIGRHVPQKGFDVLLRAFAMTVEAGDNTHDVLLAGSGPENERLRHLASSLGLDNRVQFLGRVTHDEAVRLFVGCSFFVLPSRHEPMGIVNLEAMAAGKAIVATRVGGVPELVDDGRTGLMVEGGDTTSLCHGLQLLCRDENLRHRLGEAGAARARDFDWASIADQYLSIYNLLLPATISHRVTSV